MKTINLIQTRVSPNPQMEIVAALLRRISLWALAILIFSGVAVSAIFYYIRAREEQLAQTKQQLSQIVTQSTAKEGLLASVKQRSAQITKIFGVQKQVSKVFDLIAALISPNQISSVSLDDANNVILMIHAQSIPEAVSITDVLVTQTTLNKVRAPQLVSFVLGKDGGIEIGLSFITVF